MALLSNSMSRNVLSLCGGIILSIVLNGLLNSCSCICNNNTPTTSTNGYVDNLEKFHSAYFMQGINGIKYDKLALYVDCSTCIAMGQQSPFFQSLIPCWVNATKEYYSIKGSEIVKEEDDTFSLLRSIKEVNYADLKTAVEMMAKSDHESVLLTDGEYYQQSIAKGNINNPYMANAFKEWLKKGHDIYFLTEPYVESNNGQCFNKKRFYILFTDTRLKGNIYDRIMQTVDLSLYKDVDIFHLSADHPSLLAEGNSSTVNANLNASVKGFGNMEVQDWPISWEEGIEPLVVNAVDPNTGNALQNGDFISKGIKVDRNSFGGYRISKVVPKIYNINQEFTDFCSAKIAGEKIGGKLEPMPQPQENFVKMDEKEFTKHGVINLHFDTQMFTPDFVLNGSPYNFFKIDICVSEVQDMFSQFAHIFEFDSIDMPGQTNSSVAESIKQCLADPDIKGMITSCPIYSIYVKSSER